MIFRYSTVNMAHECLRKFQNVVVMGQKEDSNSIDLEFGTALHLGLNTMFEGDDYEAVYKMYWDSLQGRQLRVSRFDWAHLKELGPVFLSRFNKLHYKKFKPFKTEAQMEIPFEGHTLQGTADYLGEYEGVPSVFDWKTSASEYKERKALTNEQLYIYAYMAKEKFGFVAEQIGYKVFIKSEERIQTVKIKLTETKLEDMINNVKMMVRDLSQRQEFPRNPGCYCTFPSLCYPNGGLKA